MAAYLVEESPDDRRFPTKVMGEREPAAGVRLIAIGERTSAIPASPQSRTVPHSKTAVASISIRNSETARHDTPIHVLAGGFVVNISLNALPTASMSRSPWWTM
jgi:hypothetical protein